MSQRMKINHVRAAFRTVLHGLIVTVLTLLLAAPEIYQGLGYHAAEATGIVAGILALSTIVARLMALPIIDDWLKKYGLSIEQIHSKKNGGK